MRFCRKDKGIIDDKEGVVMQRILYNIDVYEIVKDI